MSDDVLARALGYPYPAPAPAYLFTGGTARPLPADWTPSGRMPVIAVGSNRAPEQLRRKFGDDATVPVTWADLPGFDVVYSAHMSGYGAIPATLHPSAGTVVRVALTWLDPAQLDRMHETEAVGVSYDYGVFRGLDVSEEDARGADAFGCYVSRRGALALDGAPVALAEVEARGRRFRACAHPDKLARVHRRHGGAGAFEPWLLDLVGSPERRRDLVARLAATAMPFAHPAFTVELG